MSPENNEGKGPIEDQVKRILSGLGGEVGDFFSQPSIQESKKTEGSLVFGKLQEVILNYTCGENCNGAHYMVIPLDAFKSLFCDGDDPIGFDNFKFSELANKKELQDLLARCTANEQAAEKTSELLAKTKALADRTSIENSHLKVENDALRRELKLVKTGSETRTQTALDLVPPKRRWNFLPDFKGFRLIGGK